MKIFLFIIALLLPLGIAILGFLRKKNYKKDSSLLGFFQGDYEFGSNEVSHLMISTSLALGNAIIFLVFLGYTIGFSALWIQGAWCLGICVAGFFAYRIRKISTGKTMHGLLGSRFSPIAAKVAGISSIIGFTLNLGWELTAGISIFSQLNISTPVTILLLLILVGIVCLYTLSGGIKSNVWTNTLYNKMSYISLFALVIFLAFFSGKNLSLEVGSLSLSIGPAITFLGIGGFISNLITSIVWQFVDLSAWQNIASSSDTHPSIPKKGLFSTALILMSIPGMLGLLSGALLRGIPGLDANSILPTIIQMLIDKPLWFIIIVPGFIAAMLSTVDGFLLASAFTYSFDLKKEEQKPRSKKTISLFMIISAVLGTLLVFTLNALEIIDLFSLIYLAYSAQLVLFPAIVALLSNAPIKKSFGSASIILGLLGAIVSTVIAVLTHNTLLITWIPVLGIVVSGIVLILGIRKSPSSL